ncbi:site-specific integrase [Amphritea sp. 1_MG-2023]|uniref:tyrosine-type recombinase/integrase n=1 Tax=Amphritea sp. 1_MG-2023 TaxID=3062670 RepID=UPI0026E11808|nr:site-specific integrase [Amphritea sp. 1_MG-2023]MDO6564636.1 site-specific integrase [Amphritea sp. 1_MG-2023]
MSTSSFAGMPLFDSAKHFNQIPRNVLFPDQAPAVEAFVLGVDVDGAIDDYRYTKAFLTSYSKKSQDTYDKFRGDAERLLLWAWLIKRRSVAMLRRSDLEEYTDFVAKPDPNWQTVSIERRFLMVEGVRQPNPQWRPFRLAGAGKGRLNTKSWQGLFSNLSVFFNYLMAEDYAPGNHIPIVKKNCPYLRQETGINTARRLSELQWEYLLSAAKSMADTDVQHERTLFVVATLKSLKLRISELSERPNWLPVMSHFHRDHEGNWWFRTYGKGSKERDVSISNEYLDFLKRYRLHRGLTPLPAKDSAEPVVDSRVKHRGIGSRQLRNIVESALEEGCHALLKDGFEVEASELRAATTHWLRHTGASMEVAAGRNLAHVQADLGHGSIRTTDELYVDSDNMERASSAKGQEV